MELTRESARTRRLILLAAWIVAAAITILHTLAMNDYIGLLESLGRRGADQVDTPLQRTLPMVYADTQTWVRYALELLETDAWRIRTTVFDNAPHGREVHWNTAFAWLIAGTGWVRHVLTSEPLALAVERGLAWINPGLLLSLLVLVGAWTARRAGGVAGAFVMLAMFGHPEFHEGFIPNFVDHHGLLSVANFVIVLGVFFMGAGWVAKAGDAAAAEYLPATRDAARGAARFSALAGAAGMWVSAASVAPGIAITGVAGLLATLLLGRRLQRDGAQFDGGLWRLWGRVGGAATLACYLLEYAPQHLGLRLEVNHPGYALAWWGGAELVAELGERFLRIAPARRPWWRLALPLLAVAAAPLTIVLGGSEVFIIRDPTLRQISAFVAEGQTLLANFRRAGAEAIWVRVPWAAGTLLPALWLMRRTPPAGRLLLAFSVIASLVFLPQGLYQVRFFANAAGAQVVVMLGVLLVVGRRWGLRAGRWVALAAIVLLCFPQRLPSYTAVVRAVQKREVDRMDARQPLYRDIARALRASAPDGEIILLSNPDASTSIGYYGRLKTIGTLYWENLDGMKAAAAMHAATSIDEARDRMQARRITHFALLSEASFLQGFHRLANPAAPEEEWRQSIAPQLILRHNIPLWLEEIPYTPPPDTLLPDLQVVLYQTRFGTPAAEEAFREARAQLASGDLAAAERAIDRALEQSPAIAEFWKLKSEFLLSRGALGPAVASLENTLAHAPPSHQPEIASSAGDIFYRAKVHDAAVQFYRASLAGRFHAMTASNLGWILATSRDDRVRDGATALALGRQLVAENPASYDFLSVLAAALAETAQYDEAVEVAARALAQARANGQPTAIARAEERLRTYQGGRPWRQ